MDFIELGLIVGGLIIGGIVMYLVGVQGMRAAIAHEAKSNALMGLMKELGFKNAKIQDFNGLTDDGLKRLLTFAVNMRQQAAPSGSSGQLAQLMQIMSTFSARPAPQGAPTQ